MGNTMYTPSAQGGVAAATTIKIPRNSWHKDTSPRVIVERLTPRAFSASADDVQICFDVLQRQIQQKLQDAIITLVMGKQQLLSHEFVETYASSATQNSQDILKNDNDNSNGLWLLGVNGVYYPITVARGPSVTHWTASVTIRV